MLLTCNQCSLEALLPWEFTFSFTFHVSFWWLLSCYLWHCMLSGSVFKGRSSTLEQFTEHVSFKATGGHVWHERCSLPNFRAWRESRRFCSNYRISAVSTNMKEWGMKTASALWTLQDRISLWADRWMSSERHKNHVVELSLMGKLARAPIQKAQGKTLKTAQPPNVAPCI